MNGKSSDFARLILKIVLPEQDREYLLGDYAEIYSRIHADKGSVPANIWLLMQCARAVPLYLSHSLFWSVIMFFNYLKVTLRSFIRQRGYSIINILGLSAGLACCIFITLFVHFELSYDAYHDSADNIYRVTLTKKSTAGEIYYSDNVAVFAQAILSTYPQVEEAVRLTWEAMSAIKSGDRIFYEDRNTQADNSVFRVFDIPFIEGDPETALERPNTAVIAADLVPKYFGDTDPMGKSIRVDTVDYEITGIVSPPPRNTHFKYGIIRSLITSSHEFWYDTWFTNATFTYIKLSPETDAVQFGSEIRNFARQFVADELDRNGVEYIFELQPLKSLHFLTITDLEFEAPGNPLFIRVFTAVGILILLIACLNFINLSTARSAKRACEVGLRKVVGASRKQLISQFIGEALFMTCTALVIALLAVIIFMPLFNGLTEIDFTPAYLLKPAIMLFLVATVLIVGLFAGSYPALFLSAFRPVQVLKGSLSSKSRSIFLRQSLTVVQFAISIILIVGTLIIYQQLNYMKGYNLGFEKEQKLILQLPNTGLLIDKYESVKEQFGRHASVNGVAVSGAIPGREMQRYRLFPTGQMADNSMSIDALPVDHDFIAEYGIEMAAGRPFMKEMGQDSVFGTLLMNEAAVKLFGFSSYDEALNTTFYDDRPIPLVGVVKNFHVSGVQNEVRPLVMSIAPNSFSFITLNIAVDNLENTLGFVEQTYRKLFPQVPYEYFFLDRDFERQYAFEMKTGKVFSLFTLLGIVIAGMGLFGLVTYITEQRTREIGIRKVLGAGSVNLTILFVREFIKWVLAANILAWPLGWYVYRSWLQNFAYRIDVGLGVFFIAGISALLIAVLTVSVKSLKAANANPVESLKYE